MKPPRITWAPVIALLALIGALGMLGYILGVSLVLHIARSVRAG